MRSRVRSPAALVVAPLLVVLAAPSPKAEQTVEYIKPIRGPVVRHFEPPPTPYAPGHRGIDIAAPPGTAVVASASGIVHFAGQVGGDLFVSIDHSDGLRTTYSYLSLVAVRKGEPVAQGEVVALSGEGHTGVEPPHLHFGLVSGSTYLDPEVLLVRSLRRNLWRVIHLAPE